MSECLAPAFLGKQTQAETVNSGSAEPDRVNTREGNKSNLSLQARYSPSRVATGHWPTSLLPPSSRQAIFPIHHTGSINHTGRNCYV
ncbi:hypothetical protein AVO30_17655 [Yersinia pestis]|uniref:Uncharacterized protein n=1 Tax=Yersinia pestis TaxID=632 RepID=Q74RE4_YERPE|nr:hypothetical protein YPE_3666 [Yersinia pestis CA88-4125]KJG85106.1 hypothetical protein RN23_11185 [Yersinia pestis subsp. microtus bv. Ulegeica]KKM51384.1 hypothetical protein KD37_09505 [Yersinia pestis subsp. pestis bv. Orientalis]KKM54084.1 hypothetical protein VT69_21095 [Yersinia pestis]KPD41127.1 hypothetical protein AC472_15380 [Yersinia pestis subsp. microtus bv. Caucasica]KPD52950.1 hypothetical protein AC596_14660 [Yersinia pestis subsp. microtus bv. Hissarica]KPD54390.1 hypoth